MGDHVPDDGLKPMFPPIEASAWTWNAEAGAFNRHMFYRHESQTWSCPCASTRRTAGDDVLDAARRGWLPRGRGAHMVRRATRRPRDDGLWLLGNARHGGAAARPAADRRSGRPASRYGDFLCQGRRLRTCWISTSTIISSWPWRAATPAKWQVMANTDRRRRRTPASPGCATTMSLTWAAGAEGAKR